MTTHDLRNANRYQVVAQVVFWWCGLDRLVHAGQGFTRNISSSGAQIASAICPPNGVRVHVEIRLPQVRTRAHGLLLHGEGIVARVSNQGSGSEFAVYVHFYPERVSFSEGLSLPVIASPR